ncbi:hypothetical protein [Hymenobacter pini]|uniref:hypothetical protein n=1 Tax=Hymenobacter pini TaxID=2880879 RepID=UPI001CF2220C|nr:hypothetical protein [Hymenobacter pini]MCA8830428.1 hypothetical protein [Hymenobacter pini]
MSTYLSMPELVARIHLGNEVEQWLSHEKNVEYTLIRWLVIGREKGRIAVTYHESLDEGDEDSSDVYEFSALDPENTPYGVTHGFDSVEKALDFATTTYGASNNKFVAGGMIQEEYVKNLL